MGGALSLASAVKVPGLTCAVCFYGIPDEKFADPRKIAVPMQFHFGNKDHSKGFSDLEVSFVENVGGLLK